MTGLCGIDCEKCPMNQMCKGCKNTNGHPFSGDCVLVECCINKKISIEEYKQRLMDEFNELNIPDMPKVTELYSLRGGYVNLEYELANKQKIKLLNDNNIYLGNQLEKKNSPRCYGIVADNNYLLVCEYGENGTDPSIIIYKKRKLL